MSGLKDLFVPLYRNKVTRITMRRVLPFRYRLLLRKWLNPDQEAVQWIRVVMNREIRAFIGSLDCAHLDALEISGTGAEGRYNFRSYRSVQFPAYDVCAGPLPEQFDLIIAEQVFEHILRPDVAAKNVLSMLRPGGVFVISTPFLLKVHGFPDDLYRWTEHGMRQLLETAGFSVLSTGSWGNRDYFACPDEEIADMTADLSWTTYDPEIHTLENEPQFPIVVWAFAKKPQ